MEQRYLVKGHFVFRFLVNIEVQTDSFPGQCRQETPMKEQQSGFFKRPVAVYVPRILSICAIYKLACAI